jgi:hypothetical protein
LSDDADFLHPEMGSVEKMRLVAEFILRRVGEENRQDVLVKSIMETACKYKLLKCT